MSETSKSIKPMQHFQMSDFLRGQASRIMTSVANNDDTGFVCKHGKPVMK